MECTLAPCYPLRPSIVGRKMFLFLSKENFLLAGLCLGFACATKQYGMMVALVTGIWTFVHYGKEKFGRLTLFSIISFLPLMLPFLIWDFESFYQMTVKVPLSMNFRTDSFNIVAILWREFNIRPGAFLYTFMPFFGLIGSFFLIKKYRYQKFLGLTYSLVLFFSLIFFFGKQAFCNYYYFLAIFVLLSFFFQHFYLKTKLN